MPFIYKKIIANIVHSRRLMQWAIITAYQPSKKVLEAKIICQYNGISERIYIIKY
jgi:hypothetical protein